MIGQRFITDWNTFRIEWPSFATHAALYNVHTKHLCWFVVKRLCRKRGTGDDETPVTYSKFDTIISLDKHIPPGTYRFGMFHLVHKPSASSEKKRQSLPKNRDGFTLEGFESKCVDCMAISLVEDITFTLSPS